MADPGYTGDMNVHSWGTDFAAINFIAQQAIARVAGATIVKVVAVTNAGGIEPVGFVDLQPLVNMVDGQMRATAHGVIYNIPYFRIQGGVNAIIIDPAIGDIGLAVFADRDISSVKATRAQANPGSRRRNSMADGLYVGGFLNGAPTQYIVFNGSGVTIHSATVTIEGNLIVTGDVTASGTSLHTHIHSGVTTGGGDTGAPV